MSAEHPATAPDGSSGTLGDWLHWLEQLHPTEIDLGLTRIEAVASRAGLRDISLPLITVGGTNGKGSTVALLAAIYREAGYRVGDYTSPHIARFNERIRLQGQPVDDASIVAALAQVEAVRDDVSLTYYEYTTLAAMRIFLEAGCDIVILEVGLGGRLDATNLWSADCAIVTSIALDHQAWLGHDRSTISLEKVAIGRPGRPMIIGDTDPPAAMLTQARQSGMQLIRPELPAADTGLSLRGDHQRRNAACALAAVDALQPQRPVDAAAIQRALQSVQVPGRMERRQWQGQAVLLDVAHNPAAARELAVMLASEHAGQVIDVTFAVLADKDVAGIVRELAPCVRHWHCLALDVPRALPVAELARIVTTECSPAAADGAAAAAPVAAVLQHADAASAWQAVTEADADLIVVTGSFYTVGAVLDSQAGDEHGI